MSYSALWMDHHHATLLTFSKEKGDLDKMVVIEEIITADKPVEHIQMMLITILRISILFVFFTKLSKN